MRKLLLFDIDGTLLSTKGAARRAFERALIEVYGTTGPIATHRFDGKTDPQIARELLRLAGLSDATIDAKLDALWAHYLDGLSTELAHPGHATQVFPGVVELLGALAERVQDACVGLLTGNIARGAELKLVSAGIAGHFGFGAYGSDCERRDGLPAIAVERARACYGKSFQGRDIVVIGDTPNDVTCGQSLGVFTLAVATGGYTSDDLARAGADVTLPNLAATAEVLELLLNR